jgi:O-antigen ligase
MRAAAVRPRASTDSGIALNDADGLRQALRDPLRLALAAWLILSISRLHQYIGILGVVRPVLLLLVFCIGYVVVRPSSVTWGAIGRTWPTRGIVALAVLACLSAVFGMSLGSSATFFLNVYGRLLLILAVLMAATRTLADVRLWVWTYLVSVFILVFLSIFVMDTAAAPGPGIARLHSEHVYDGNDLGVLLVAGVPLALWMFQTSKGWGRYLAVAVVIGAPMTATLTGSRGSFVGLCVLVGALFFLATHVALWRRIAIVLAVAVSVLVAAPAGYWSFMESIVSEDDYNRTDPMGRKQTWIRGLGYVAAYPVFGVGVNNFTRAEATLSPLARNHVRGTNVPVLAPHNTFLQAAAEMGISGFIVWASFFWMGILTLTSMRKRLPRRWSYGNPDERFLYQGTIYLPVTFMVVAATSFFVSHLYLPGIYLFVIVLGGLLWELDRRLMRHRRRRPSFG